MTGGTFKAYVSGLMDIEDVLVDPSSYQCNMENGVGSGAAGGALNCGGKYGRYFHIYCEQTCTPYLAIGIVRMWQYKILSAESGADFYLPGYFGDDLSITSSYSTGEAHDLDDFETVIGPSAFWADERLILTIPSDTYDYMWASISLPKTA